MTNEATYWLLRVNDLHRRTGYSYHHLANTADLSLTAVANILDGNMLPTPESLRKLLRALTDNLNTVDSILGDFLSEHPI